MHSIPQKRCSKCGVEKPLSEFSPEKRHSDGLSSQCKRCRADRMNVYRADNPHKYSEWVKSNQDRRKSQQANWYQGKRDQQIERVRHWRKNNPDKRRAQISAYRKAKPDKIRLIGHRRRARQYQQGGSFTEQQWLDLKAQYNNMCLCCKRQEPVVSLTADHIVPIARGGSSYIDNIQPLCFDCNRRKNVRTIDYRDESSSNPS